MLVMAACLIYNGAEPQTSHFVRSASNCMTWLKAGVRFEMSVEC